MTKAERFEIYFQEYLAAEAAGLKYDFDDARKRDRIAAIEEHEKLSRKTKAAIKKYGEFACRNAAKMVQCGEGARDVQDAYFSNLSSAYSAINAGVEILAIDVDR